MARAFGIINSSANYVHVEGLQTYRPIGAFAFAGRYRVIDFPISNMSNSDIDRILVYVRENPRSLTEHIRSAGSYNINSKRGHIQVLFAEANSSSDIYNTDIAAFMENLSIIERLPFPYVVIAPSYMVYAQNYKALLEQHIESGADISLLYQRVTDAKDNMYLNCDYLTLNRQKGVESIERNRGTAKERNIFMDTYVMRRELFIELVRKALSISSVYTLANIVNHQCADLDVRAIPHCWILTAPTSSSMRTGRSTRSHPIPARPITSRAHPSRTPWYPTAASSRERSRTPSSAAASASRRAQSSGIPSSRHTPSSEKASTSITK